VVPEYLLRLPRVRVLRCREDWGPATKFIGAIQDELAAGAVNTLIMVVDDDRLYPRDALETYLFYSEQLPNAATLLPRRCHAVYFRLGRRQNDSREVPSRAAPRSRNHWVRKLLDSTEVLRRIALGLFRSPHPWRFILMTFGLAHGLAARGVKRYVFPASAMMRSVRRQRRTVSLNKIHGRQKLNNETIAFFRDAWDIISAALIA